ncbi:MAG TPA: hypothetical protein VHE34_30425 [Puia sp.]|uniref:hypothetical protein n=1 Tax=Puia sp. TaxID=2045100 RepID=UPI002C2A93CF|nr:hypothetical protein [Puia sp.]HVU99591.1 hypothetical protein [Puia sp.]
MVIEACLYDIQVIGEAVNQLAEDVKVHLRIAFASLLFNNRQTVEGALVWTASNSGKRWPGWTNM